MFEICITEKHLISYGLQCLINLSAGGMLIKLYDGSSKIKELLLNQIIVSQHPYLHSIYVHVCYTSKCQLKVSYKNRATLSANLSYRGVASGHFL